MIDAEDRPRGGGGPSAALPRVGGSGGVAMPGSVADTIAVIDAVMMPLMADAGARRTAAAADRHAYETDNHFAIQGAEVECLPRFDCFVCFGLFGFFGASAFLI
jgi:hypothetical protein